MIKTKRDLKNCIKADADANERKNKKGNFRNFLLYEHLYLNWKFIKLLRKDEYYTNNNSGMNKLMYIIVRRRKNKLARKLGFTIPVNVFAEGLRIWHYGNIVVNGYARVGKNCILHGDNCIGNNGFSTKAPQIGNNVDVGVGAKIIGDIKIADGIVIGANSVVNKSFLEPNVVIAGVPAKVIKKIN